MFLLINYNAFSMQIFCFIRKVWIIQLRKILQCTQFSLNEVCCTYNITFFLCVYFKYCTPAFYLFKSVISIHFKVSSRSMSESLTCSSWFTHCNFTWAWSQIKRKTVLRWLSDDQFWNHKHKSDAKNTTISVLQYVCETVRSGW